MDNQTIILIPTRKGSKSVEDKNSRPIKGKPLIYYTLDACKEAMDVDPSIVGVFISTNDDKICDLIDCYYDYDNKISVIGRSEKVSHDKASTESVIEEFIERATVQYYNIILVQATNPFLRAIDLIKGQDLFFNTTCDSVFSAVKCDNFIWMEEKDNFSPINYDPQNRPRRQDREDVYVLENGSFYIFPKEDFQKQKNRLGKNPHPVLMRKESIFELDTWEDFRLIEKLL